MSKTDVYELLINKRKELGLNFKELEQQTGIPDSTICDHNMRCFFPNALHIIKYLTFYYNCQSFVNITNKEDIPQLLKKKMDENKLTPKDVAKKIGICKNSAKNHIEKTCPDGYTFLLYCKLYHISLPDEILKIL